MFAGQLFRLQKRIVQLVDLVRFALRLGASHAKCLGFTSRSRVLFGFFLRASRLDLPGRGSEVPLNFPFFLLRGSLAENIFVFRVGLREVVEAESLRELRFAAAFGVA